MKSDAMLQLSLCPATVDQNDQFAFTKVKVDLGCMVNEGNDLRHRDDVLLLLPLRPDPSPLDTTVDVQTADSIHNSRSEVCSLSQLTAIDRGMHVLALRQQASVCMRGTVYTGIPYSITSDR